MNNEVSFARYQLTLARRRRLELVFPTGIPARDRAASREMIC